MLTPGCGTGMFGTQLSYQTIARLVRSQVQFMQFVCQSRSWTTSWCQESLQRKVLENVYSSSSGSSRASISRDDSNTASTASKPGSRSQSNRTNRYAHRRTNRTNRQNSRGKQYSQRQHNTASKAEGKDISCKIKAESKASCKSRWSRKARSKIQRKSGC